MPVRMCLRQRISGFPVGGSRLRIQNSVSFDYTALQQTPDIQQYEFHNSLPYETAAEDSFDLRVSRHRASEVSVALSWRRCLFSQTVTEELYHTGPSM